MIEHHHPKFAQAKEEKTGAPGKPNAYLLFYQQHTSAPWQTPASKRLTIV